MLLQTLLKFQPRQLQQLDRLLQLRRHNEFLTESQIQSQLHRTRHSLLV